MNYLLNVAVACFIVTCKCSSQQTVTRRRCDAESNDSVICLTLTHLGHSVKQDAECRVMNDQDFPYIICEIHQCVENRAPDVRVSQLEVATTDAQLLKKEEKNMRQKKNMTRKMMRKKNMTKKMRKMARNMKKRLNLRQLKNWNIKRSRMKLRKDIVNNKMTKLTRKENGLEQCPVWKRNPEALLLTSIGLDRLVLYSIDELDSTLIKHGTLGKLTYWSVDHHMDEIYGISKQRLAVFCKSGEIVREVDHGRLHDVYYHNHTRCVYYFKKPHTGSASCRCVERNAYTLATLSTCLVMQC